MNSSTDKASIIIMTEANSSFSREQLNAFIRDALSPRGSPPQSSLDHICQALGIPPQRADQSVYDQFVERIIRPNEGLNASWNQHLSQWPTSGSSSSVSASRPTQCKLCQGKPCSCRGVEVDLVAEITPISSATGAAARRLHRMKTGVEPSLAIATRENAKTGCYMDSQMYIDQATGKMRTDDHPKVWLAELVIRPAVDKYQGYDPSRRPLSRFLVSEGDLNALQKAPRLMIPEQPWPQPLAIGNTVTFKPVSDNPTDITSFINQYPDQLCPPSWVGPTMTQQQQTSPMQQPQPPMPAAAARTGGAAYRGTTVHPRSKHSGKYIQQASAREMLAKMSLK